MQTTHVRHVRSSKARVGGLLLVLALATSGSGCGYAGVAASGDAAIVTRNDWFLFGLLRKTYVCKITPAGLTQCSSAESP